MNPKFLLFGVSMQECNDLFLSACQWMYDIIEGLNRLLKHPA